MRVAGLRPTRVLAVPFSIASSSADETPSTGLYSGAISA